MDERKRENAVALALLAIGAAVRLAVDNVTEFSRADETSYLIEAQAEAGRFFTRFPIFVQEYLTIPDRWQSPPPIRWAHWALIADGCGLSSACNHTTLAAVSTLAGIATLVFTWLLGRELLGGKAALVALALSIASPLQLHLGRRALQDEIACASVLAALWAFARALSVARRNDGLAAHWIAVLCGTWALAEKETAILWAVPLFALWLQRLRARGLQRRDLLLLLPPLLDVACFSVLAHGPAYFYQIARDNLSSLPNSSYVAQQMSGPPYRYLLDLFVVTPIPFLLCIAGCGALIFDRGEDSRGARELCLLFWLAILLWASAPKDLRYFAPADALVRLLAAWLVVTFARRGRPATAIAAILVLFCIGSELQLFERIFVQRGVYDPTASELLKAVDAIPR